MGSNVKNGWNFNKTSNFPFLSERSYYFPHHVFNDLQYTCIRLPKAPRILGSAISFEYEGAAMAKAPPKKELYSEPHKAVE